MEVTASGKVGLRVAVEEADLARLKRGRRYRVRLLADVEYEEGEGNPSSVGFRLIKYDEAEGGSAAGGGSDDGPKTAKDFVMR